MSTATTTWATVRDKHIELIRALTPTTRSTVRFERIPNEARTLDEFATKSPEAALRKFEIRKAGIAETPLSWNLDITQEEGTTLIRIAYPVRAAYGASGVLDLDKIADQDIYLIRDELEKPSNYVSGQLSASCSVDFIPDPEISITEIECTFVYYRAA